MKIPRFFFLAVLLLPGVAAAQLVTFDDIGSASVTDYLSGYGIAFSSAAGITPHIFEAPSWNPAVSAPNEFNTTGPGTGYNYIFTFSSELQSLSFTRPELLALTSSGVTHAQWSATAYSDTGSILGTVGEPLIASFGTVAAHTFTLGDFGSAIDHLVFFTNVQNFAGTNLVIDNFSMTAAIPEPETYAMLLAGLGLLGFEMKRRRKATFA